MHFDDPYELLGLNPEASEEEVKAAAEKLAEDPEKKEQAEAALAQIQDMRKKPGDIAETESPEETENTEEEKKEEPSASPAAEAPRQEAQTAETEKPASPGKIALAIAAIVVLIAILAALILVAVKQNGKSEVPAEETTASQLQEGEPPAETAEPTTPADGNPDDETCKGNYTVSDAELKKAAGTVVATMDGYELTNAELQIYYWMGIQSYVQSNPYIQFMGIDLSRPLETQVCPLAEGQSWQQFFLKQALTSWQNYQAMAAEAEANGRELEQELLDALKALPEDMDAEAKANGFADAAELLSNNVGAGSTVEDYVKFMEVYHRGYGYFADVVGAVNPSEEELEAYYQEHESELQEGGINQENRVATARHILIAPEDTENEESWAEAEKKAGEILDQYLAGNRTSESFAALAKEHTMDPGSKETGGLYEDFAQGQMVPQFDEWCFDASRKNGDTDIVKTEFGYHIMYYVSSRPVWQDQVKQIMAQNVANKLIDDSSAKYPMEVDFSSIVLGTLTEKK